MRLVTYAQDGSSCCGVLHQDRVFPTEALARSAGLKGAIDWSSTKQVLEAGRSAWAGLQDAVSVHATSLVGLDLADVELRAPIEDPDKIICLGLNYRDHAAETNLDVPPVPMLFAKFRNSLTGPSGPIVLPTVTEAVDYEAELAVVIGRTCKNVDAESALEYVAGVMALNDVSARDLQHQTSQWLAGKALDTFAPCGPALVLLDEVENIQALTIRTRVNGVTVQDGTTSDMIFSVAETVAFLSRLMTLVPGDIIATGTPPGTGFSREPKLLLHDGDLVEVEITGIGLLSNRVHGSSPSIDGEHQAGAEVGLVAGAP